MTAHDKKLIAALGRWLGAECDRVEAEIGRECRGKDLPTVWHNAYALRRAIQERADSGNIDGDSDG